MSYPIGIDLGTTNSVVCVWRRGGVETILIEGRPTLPSVISVRAEGEILVGHPAKSRALVEAGSSVTSAKRFIGDGKTTWEIHGRTYTPIEVDKLILERLKRAAEEYLKEPVREVVITVPAYFNNNQKRDTKLAGEAAGLKVLQLLPEPTAAAISYGLDKGKDQTILVYDLGGGTFDVSVLRVRKNRFTAVAVDGDFHLGGDDFDNLLVEHLLDLLAKRANGNVSELRSLFGRKGQKTASPKETPKNLLLARQQLKEAAEQAKIELSESDTARVTLPEVLGTALDEEITLAKYNELIEPLIKRTTDKIRDVLKSAEMSAADIDRVILVGGSTRNRLVKVQVAAALGEPWTSDRVDEVVAEGAAIVAAQLASPEDGSTARPEDMVPEIVFEDVTPFSLGVRATRDKEADFFKVLVPKNTPLEKAKAEHAFTTLRSNQKSVDIAVFQGESPECRQNTFVGGFRMTGIPPAPAGQPKIVVRFNMDNRDLLSVTAECSTLKSQKILDVNFVSREDELPESSPQVDIMFLVDTSGSMSGELDGVKASGLDFANRVIEAGVDCRLGLLDFDKPIGGTYKWEVFGPMDPAGFPTAVSGLKIGRLGGCGCYVGEENTIPVMEAFAQAFPASDRLKIGILISDEVGNDATAIRRLVEILQSAQVTLHVVGVGGSCHERLARETGGRFWNIAASRGRVDFSDLLESIAVEISSLALR